MIARSFANPDAPVPPDPVVVTGTITWLFGTIVIAALTVHVWKFAEFALSWIMSTSPAFSSAKKISISVPPWIL